jgi:hypothetical protein
MNIRAAGWVCVTVLIGATGTACSKAATAQRTPTAPTPIATPSSAAGAVCAPTTSVPGGPVNDPNGPYYHRVAVATTADGVRVSGARIVLEHASVPDGVRTADGRVLIYYVNGADGGVWVAGYADGTAAAIGPIAINGVSRPNGVVDPDAFVVDGRIRLAYLAGFGGPGATGARAMCLAESTDGVNFSALGPAVAADGTTWTDPSVTQLTDGTWLMAISDGGNTVLARSTDGRSFVTGERLSYGGVPEVTALDAGRVRLYVCAMGIVSYVSADAGASWRFEATVVSGPGLACDPSRVAGTDLFVYKTGY